MMTQTLAENQVGSFTYFGVPGVQVSSWNMNMFSIWSIDQMNTLLSITVTEKYVECVVTAYVGLAAITKVALEAETTLKYSSGNLWQSNWS